MLPKSFEMLLTKRLIVGSQYGILFAREGEEYGSSQCENYEQPDERKNVSYSLWNDSLLGKRVKPGCNYACFSAGIDGGSSVV